MECSSGIRTGSKEIEQIMLCVYFKIFSEGRSLLIYIYKYLNNRGTSFILIKKQIQHNINMTIEN